MKHQLSATQAIPGGPTRLERTVIYECPWVNLYRDRVALPTGHIIEQYHQLEFGAGSVCVIVENDAGQILMESISRYATGLTTWELPAGRIEEGESALAAAQREVFEETGCETSGHTEIYRVYPLTGISNLSAYFIRCRLEGVTGSMDENEVDAVRWFSRAELKELIRKREISDGFALIGLLLVMGD